METSNAIISRIVCIIRPNFFLGCWSALRFIVIKVVYLAGIGRRVGRSWVWSSYSCKRELRDVVLFALGLVLCLCHDGFVSDRCSIGLPHDTRRTSSEELEDIGLTKYQWHS